MSLSMLTSRDAILEAMREYDELGADEFLQKYGFGRAKSYRLHHDGRTYDSKAIAGVAVGNQHPARGPMTSTDFTGGLNVRAKLETLGFEVVTDVEPSSGFGPGRALELISESWDEPTSLTKKIAAWLSPAGRQLALILEGGSVRVWTELEPPQERGRPSIEYPGSRTRHSNLKSAASRLAQPFVSYMTTVPSEAALDDLIDWYGGQTADGLDPQGLARMRDAFLRVCSDFKSFQSPGDVYPALERHYKDELVGLFNSNVRPLVSSARDGGEHAVSLWQVFWELFKTPLLTNEKKAPQNLIDWRAYTRLKPGDASVDEQLGAALYDLLRGEGDQFERLERFIPIVAERTKAQGSTSPPDDGRSIGSYALMLDEPTEAAIMRWSVYDRALQILRRQRLKEVATEKAGRYREAMELNAALKEHMESSWGWTPRDFIDVQSFIHTAVGETKSLQGAFGDQLRRLLDRFAEVRSGPFQKDDALWEYADRTCETLKSLGAVKTRPDITISWSPGKGVWAGVPWIALLDQRVTQSTQDGVYVVFLISEDLSRVYLTLMQGITKAVETLGQSAAAERFAQQAEAFRRKIISLQDDGFVLTGDIDLGATGWRAKSYEVGTIAFVEFEVAELPTNDELDKMLAAVLSAYEAVAHDDHAQPESKLDDAAYTIDDAMSGLFMERSEFEKILRTWRGKKNLILQGAPGVGKSFVARRLAYALLEEKATSRVEAVQFHQSYGYEDFVQGYRPTEQGGFELRNGIFYDVCKRAVEDPENAYVLIVDEINRGNLSKIFGELMLLIEHDKRDEDWGVRLAYEAAEADNFWVPSNLYLIGMMNTADRSLSLVDYALRRRFAFHTLAPAFSSPRFREYLLAHGVAESSITQIVKGMNELNSVIEADHINLGRGFSIGHSFFVPSAETSIGNGWLESVVETEICPLLEEYWPDDLEKAAHWRSRLLS